MNINIIENKINLISSYYYEGHYNKYNRNVKLTKNEASNLFGSLIPYFKMLTPIIFNFSEQNRTLLLDIGFFQSIYIQQDLINELLMFFRLGGFISEDVEPNRSIRNKVLGHPISRDIYNKFISSIWFSNGDIWLYEKEGDNKKENKDLKFIPKKIKYEIPNVLSDHYCFLNKYLDKVISKLEKNMVEFKKELLELQNIIKHNAFEKVIKSVDLKYEFFFAEKYIFKKDWIEKIYYKRKTHPRYQFCINLFLNELGDYISDSLNDLNKKIDPKKHKTELIESNDFIINYVGNTFQILNKKRQIIFSKLDPKEEIFGIDYHLEVFYDNYDITLELLNMKNNLDENSEYYSSKEYLEYLYKLDNKYSNSL